MQAISGVAKKKKKVENLPCVHATADTEEGVCVFALCAHSCM